MDHRTLLSWYCDWLRYRQEHGAFDEGEAELVRLYEELKAGRQITRPEYWVASPEEALERIRRIPRQTFLPEGDAAPKTSEPHHRDDT